MGEIDPNAANALCCGGMGTIGLAVGSALAVSSIACLSVALAKMPNLTAIGSSQIAAKRLVIAGLTLGTLSAVTIGLSAVPCFFGSLACGSLAE